MTEFRSVSSYAFKRVLGRGGNANVVLYTRKTPGLPARDVVLKIIKNSDISTIRELINDGERLNQIRHPNIVSNFGYEQVGPAQFALVLEFVDGTHLGSLTPTFQAKDREVLASYVARTLLETFKEVHQTGIIHGDISSHNILISKKGEIKVADFGLARGKKTSTWQDNHRGSLEYLAPERWEEQSPSEQSDIFALGVLIFEVLLGSAPYQWNVSVSEHQRLSFFIRQKPWQIVPRWEKFFKGCFEPDPKKRFSCHQALNLIPQQHAPISQAKSQLARYCALNTKGEIGEQKTLQITEFLKRGIMLSKRQMFLVVTSALIFVGTVVIPQMVSDPDKKSGHLKPYSLTITSSPWGRVYLNGQSIGFTPIARKTLKPGYYRVRWEGPKGGHVTKTLRAYNNGAVVYRVSKIR